MHAGVGVDELVRAEQRDVVLQACGAHGVAHRSQAAHEHGDACTGGQAVERRGRGARVRLA
jgi:hypothetical protein